MTASAPAPGKSAQHKPDKAGTPASALGRLGSLRVSIAANPREVEAAQRLRYEVFHAEQEERQNAVPAGSAVGSGLARDEDHFDAYCDHLVVIDEAMAERDGLPAVVATYRLLDGRQAAHAGRFYSEAEFEIAPLLKRHAGLSFLEFGRSCVAPGYRDKRTVELLWHGSWAHVRNCGYDVMFGCASFPGTDPAEHACSLSLLAHTAGPSPDWHVEACGEPVQLPILDEKAYDGRAALRSLPPIIKGYLRLGAMFADQASIDRDFGTIDVLVLLPVSRLNARYLKYYGEEAGRHAAG